MTFRVQNSQIKNFALVVDGQTLGLIFHHELDENFVELCSGCDAVLGCRLSPAQKAQVICLCLKIVKFKNQIIKKIVIEN